MYERSTTASATRTARAEPAAPAGATEKGDAAATLTRRRFAAGAGAALLTLPAFRQGAAARAVDATPAAAECRVVAHALGETCVPRAPQRVVAFFSAADVALAVGIVPIAVDQATARSAYLRDRLRGAESFGLAWEPNLEQIAVLDPDLIVALDVVIEEVYDELSRIAPTVGVEFGEASGEWKRYNRGYAEAMGMAEEFDRAMAEYEAKAQQFRTAMGDRLAETEVAIVRASPENLRFDLPGIFIGDVVYNDAGLRLPPGLASYHEQHPERPTAEISREQLTLAEGSDVVFVWNVTGTASPEEDREQAAEVMNDPLFQRIDAVRRGRVYLVGDHWFSESVLGARMVLDDLERYLLREGA
jgi:iron complex transport system substrate-binding protein